MDDFGTPVEEYNSTKKDEELAASILGQLKKSKKLHDQFAEQFRKKYMVAGKIIAEWRQHFHISLPPDLNSQTAMGMEAKLNELHQEASFFKAEADARCKAYENANTQRYRDKFAALVAEYKQTGQKLPAKDTLASLAEFAISDTKDGQVHAEIELNFWKDILADLANSRKQLETVVILLSVEAKSMNQGKYLDHLSTKKDHSGE